MIVVEGDGFDLSSHSSEVILSIEQSIQRGDKTYKETFYLGRGKLDGAVTPVEGEFFALIGTGPGVKKSRLLVKAVLKKLDNRYVVKDLEFDGLPSPHDALYLAP